MIENAPCRCREDLLPRLASAVFPLGSSPGEGGQAMCEPEHQRRLAAFEQRLLSGDFTGVAAFYRTAPRDSRCFLLAARLALMGAVGSGDTALFTQVMEDVRAFPSRYKGASAQLGMELTEIWLRQHLHIADGCPAWLMDGELECVPSEWRDFALYLMARLFLIRRDHSKAQLMAQIALHLQLDKTVSPKAVICLNFVLALALQGQGRAEESVSRFQEAAKVAVEQQVLLPFLGLPIGAKSPLGRALKAVSGEFLRRVKARSQAYFRNLVRFHNLFTGKQLTELLSPREFAVASSLRHGLRYKEIAARMGVEVSSVNTVTKAIYSKLNIHGFSELADKVW